MAERSQRTRRVASVRQFDENPGCQAAIHTTENPHGTGNSASGPVQRWPLGPSRLRPASTESGVRRLAQAGSPAPDRSSPNAMQRLPPFEADLETRRMSDAI